MKSKLTIASKEVDLKSLSKLSHKSLRNLVPRGSSTEEEAQISILLSKFKYTVVVPKRLGGLDRRATTVTKSAWMTANPVHKRAAKTEIFISEVTNQITKIWKATDL